jgi:predicted KAP-like P-loop ATPase
MDTKERLKSTLFSSDRPIESSEEDLLGRANFAKSLSDAIKAWKGKDSLVIGLFGDWGSGKSSVKNMVVEQLREDTKNSPITIEFNPWMWSGQDRLMSAFLEEVGKAIGQVATGKQYKELKDKWSKYSATLTLGSTALGPLKAFTELSGIPWAGMVLGALKTGAEKAAKAAKNGAEASSAAAESNQSAELMKQELKKELQQLKKPLIFFLDDIDRLDKAEIRLVFQLIKINADFPNLVFIILCDRVKVEKALNEVSSGTGREYLDKIVQVGFDLPQIRGLQISKLLTEGLQEILIFRENDYRFNKDRWEEMSMDGITPFFKNIRDVRRFLSSFRFVFGLYMKEETLEINQFDLVGVEVLRVFEPDLYRQIPKCKSVLAPSNADLIKGIVNEFEQNRAVAEHLLELANANNKEITKKLLTKLFPTFGASIEGSKRMPSSDEWERQLRICEDYFFERYFCLMVPQEDIPQSTIDEILQKAGDRKWLTDCFTLLDKNGKLWDALERIEKHFTVLNIDHIETMITCFMDIYDNKIASRNQYFGLGIDEMIRNLLFRIKGISERGRILLKAMKETRGSYIPIIITSAEVRLHKKQFNNDTNYNMDMYQVEEARKICAKLINEKIAKDEIVINQVRNVFFCWNDIEGPEKPMEYAQKLIKTLDGAIKYITINLAFLQMENGGKKYFVRLKDLSEFVDISELERIVSPAIEGKQSLPNNDNSKNALSAFIDALCRRKEGKPDDPTRIEF